MRRAKEIAVDKVRLKTRDLTAGEAVCREDLHAGLRFFPDAKGTATVARMAIEPSVLRSFADWPGPEELRVCMGPERRRPSPLARELRP